MAVSTIKQNSLLDYSTKFQHFVRVNDWNNIGKAGWYTGLDAANAPATGWINAICIPASNDPYYCTVLAMSIRSTNIYVRYRNGKLESDWSAWRTI